jgi:hypothetical protein
MRRALSLIVAGLVLLGLGMTSGRAQSAGAKDIPPNVIEVFKKHCTSCHAGPGAPKGLNLIASKIALAINATSKELPDLKIIDTAKPEAGYMLKKLEGAAGISGAKMPKGRTLAPADLEILKGWLLGLKAK